MGKLILHEVKIRKTRDVFTCLRFGSSALALLAHHMPHTDDMPNFNLHESMRFSSIPQALTPKLSNPAQLSPPIDMKPRAVFRVLFSDFRVSWFGGVKFTQPGYQADSRECCKRWPRALSRILARSLGRFWALEISGIFYFIMGTLEKVPLILGNTHM